MKICLLIEAPPGASDKINNIETLTGESLLDHPRKGSNSVGWLGVLSISQIVDSVPPVSVYLSIGTMAIQKVQICTMLAC